jgi:membrane-anchored protein YejM (alkaline phosphatase superfamily)
MKLIYWGQKMKTKQTINWKNLFYLFMFITFLTIGAKMTPQWVEFQNLPKEVYLTISMLFGIISGLFLYKLLVNNKIIAIKGAKDE